MKQFADQLRWQFVVLHRNNLIVISVVVTIVYALIFFAIRGLGNTDRVLTLLIYNDPAIIGLFFVGLSVIIEINQGVFTALLVSPLNHHAYICSKVVALSIVGTLCAIGMAISVFGLDFQIVMFSMGAFLTCTIFGLFGILLVSYTSEFLQFMLRSIPVLLLISAPLFNYFGLTDLSILAYTPIQTPLDLIISSYPGAANTLTVGSIVSCIVWLTALYLITYRIFERRLTTL